MWTTWRVMGNLIGRLIVEQKMETTIVQYLGSSGLGFRIRRTC